MLPLLFAREQPEPLSDKAVELRAVARLLAGDPAGASAELGSAAATRYAGDLFRQQLYNLLHDPAVPGLARLLTIWKQMRPMSPVLLTFVLATVAVPIVIYGLMPQLHKVRVRLLTQRASP